MWTRAIELVSQQVVGISTPKYLGTGFVSYGRQRGTRVVATGQHVIEAAINDEAPIHVAYGQRILILGNTGLNRRFLHKTTWGVDSAILAFVTHELPQPTIPILNPANSVELSHVKVGTEVGWLGFPNLARISQCALERRLLLTGAKPVQQLSLRLVAARADHGGNDMV